MINWKLFGHPIWLTNSSPYFALHSTNSRQMRISFTPMKQSDFWTI